MSVQTDALVRVFLHKYADDVVRTWRTSEAHQTDCCPAEEVLLEWKESEGAGKNCFARVCPWQCLKVVAIQRFTG